MRWCWIDRFVEFESGRFATAVKSVSASEEYLNDHFPCYPIMPQSLVIEGLAQTGGLLAFENCGFSEKVILAKIPRAEFHFDARPGDLLTYRATLECSQPNGALASATSRVNGRLQAELEIMYVYLDEAFEDAVRFDRGVFLEMMHTLGAFDVGRAADGGPLARPIQIAPFPEVQLQPAGRVEVDSQRCVARLEGSAGNGELRRIFPR
jgi:3-hydroxyacyl-[acyl-carrier-protein] dehydratase